MDESTVESTLSQVAGEPAESGADNAPAEDVAVSTKRKVTPREGMIAVFNGLGVGLLLGLLLGLSISPVVSGVIATISSLLAVFLGMGEKYTDALKSLRIGAFGVFAVVGILTGLYMRANDPFAPTLLDKMKEYQSLGYSAEEARVFITRAVEADTGKARREASVLYSSSIDAGACEFLQYASAGQPMGELVNTFSEAGGGWKDIALTFRNELDPEIAAPAMIAVRNAFCGMGASGTIEMKPSSAMMEISAKDELADMEGTISGAGKNWSLLVDELSKDIPPAARKDVYVSLIKALSHE